MNFIYNRLPVANKLLSRFVLAGRNRGIKVNKTSMYSASNSKRIELLSHLLGKLNRLNVKDLFIGACALGVTFACEKLSLLALTCHRSLIFTVRCFPCKLHRNIMGLKVWYS